MDHIFSKLPPSVLIRLVPLNKHLSRLVYTPFFWQLTKRSIDAQQELLVAISKLGWVKLWPIVYRLYSAFIEEFNIRKSYTNFLEMGKLRFARSLVKEFPNLSIIAKQYYISAGKLSRAIKKGDYDKAHKINHEIAGYYFEAYVDIIMPVVIESSANMTIVHRLIGVKGDDKEFIENLIASDNYPLLVEYDQKYPIDWDGLTSIGLFDSPDLRIINYVLEKTGIEEITPEVINDRNILQILNRTVLFDYIRKYLDDDWITINSSSALSIAQLIEILPLLKTGTLQSLSRKYEASEHNYRKKLVDEYLTNNRKVPTE